MEDGAEQESWKEDKKTKAKLMELDLGFCEELDLPLPPPVPPPSPPAEDIKPKGRGMRPEIIAEREHIQRRAKMSSCPNSTNNPPIPFMVEYFWQRSKEYLYMHDLLQEMGRNIVTQECSDDTSRQSRMWSQEQIDVVLKGNKGTRKVQGIYLNSQWQYKTEWHRDCFSSLQNVILLCLSNAHISHRLNSLPTALKVFIWERCPLEALPHNIDQLYELVDLRLRHSRIKLLWNGAPYLDKLKFIDLSHSEDLIEMPNVERIQNLESLLLEGCISLVRVHESLGQLKKLVKLNMKDCKNLVFLPTKLEMNSLEELILSGCSKLEKLPEFGEDMKSLSICDLSETKVKEIPSSIVKLTNIKELSLRGSKGLVSNSWGLSRLFWFMRRPISMGLRLPSFSGLSSLKKLDLSDCNLWDGSIPDDLSGLSSLMDLDLSGNNFSSLPAGCISNLTNLEYFYLSNCLRLQSMPHLPPNLLKVDATNCPSMETSLDLQNLFASLVAKHRHLLLYEDIVLQIPGDEIPSWFEQRECYINHFRSAVLITMNIPYVRDTREWSGIAVCLLLKNMISPPGRSHQIFWSFKDSEDDIHNDCRFGCWVKNSSVESKLYTAFFPFNSLNCWRHLSGGRSHLKLLIATFLPGRSTRWESAKGNMKIMDCGWRLICKKDFEAYGASNASSSLQITELHND
ncbi:TMV resistance protein N-like [Senna tora]|uniref:TMV resistance protein N-like n=1 Tax=Senna tora TaxID=362788 RepID=A0A834T553_9FABA|nr:TMV resistance protein N-like [Senna tora]